MNIRPTYALLLLFFLSSIIILGMFAFVQARSEMLFENADLTCEAWRTYQSKANEFSIDYPKGWKAENLPFGNHGDEEVVALFIPASSPRLLVEIARRPQPGFDKLTDVADWGIARIESKYHPSNIKLQPIEEINVDGATLLRRQYHSSSSDAQWTLMDIYIGRQNDAFILTFGALDSDWDEVVSCFDHMANSFSPK